jgi:alpha-N-arabinofuranosidase
LGNTIISKAAFENPDGSPLKIDRDYFGKPRSESNPAVGPFENSGEGRILLKVK